MNVSKQLFKICSLSRRNHRVLLPRKGFISSVESQGLDTKEEEPGFHEDGNVSSFKAFKTLETNPVNHTGEHEAKFYHIDDALCKQLFQYGGFSKGFRDQAEMLNETNLMVRPATLEVIDYLKNVDLSKPVNRFLLYGGIGVGKTSVLAHAIHYAFNTRWLIVHLPWPAIWIKYPKEMVPSTRNPERMDFPLHGSQWLQHFLSQNAALLEELDLKASRQYVWSIREITEAGEPLLKIIEHGINRGKHSSDCVAVLLKEIKEQSQSGKFKTLLAIDGVNAMFTDTRIKYANKSSVKVENLTMIRGFLKMINNDWNNGVVLCSVCPRAATNVNEFTLCKTIRPLLSKEGFELLEPFVPIKVGNYTLKEALSCLDYYIDSRLIQTEAGVSELGKQELIFLSGKNPEYLMKVCFSR